MTTDTLRALAEAAGLALEYEDARGDPQTIAPETLEAVLERLGIEARSESARRDSLARLTSQAGGTLPPLVTADAGKPVLLPGRHEGQRYELTIEGGETVTGTVGRRRGGTLPAIDAPGYHELVIGEERTTIAVAPAACFWPESPRSDRLWGVAAQIYALRRPGDGGIGDFTAVAELAEAAGRERADALAISPVHAMFAADPGRASPYSPSNRLLLNGLLADPAARLGPERVADAASSLGLGERRRLWEEAAMIGWTETGRAKLALLRRLFDTLDPEIAAAFRAYREHTGATIENHAAFEVLHDTLRSAEGSPRHWRDWGADYASPEAPGVARLRGERGEDVAFHVFLQWLAEENLEAAQRRARAAGMGIGLVADLAVGVDGGGSQVWASRGDMLDGLHMGAPPDIYNAKGQDWGLAALDPHALCRSGFAPFLEMLRASLAWAGGLRIDHILGLHRVWVIPEGAPPAEGAYLHLPLNDLLRLVTLESRRHDAVVIGEDLGTVPGGLRKKLAARRILGMSVLWFEQVEAEFTPPPQWRTDSVAMTTTHDLPTVAGWWSGRDLECKEELDLYPSPEIGRDARETRERERDALWEALVASGAAEPGDPPPPEPPAAPVDAALAHVARTPCRLALAPLEDLAGAVEQSNLPGTVTEHPNWCRRLPEEARLCRGEGIERRITAFRAGREAGPAA